MTEPYDRGDLVRVTGAFKDFDGEAADPPTLRFKYRSPDGTETVWVYGADPEIVRDAEGSFYAEVVMTASGRWRFRWEAEGPGQAAVETSLIVQRTYFDA